jgi:hypothetical protein
VRQPDACAACPGDSQAMSDKLDAAKAALRLMAALTNETPGFYFRRFAGETLARLEDRSSWVCACGQTIQDGEKHVCHP